MIDTVRAVLAANRSGPPEETLEVCLALADPSMEFDSRISAIEGRRYDGHEGARRYFADMAEAWREWRNEPAEIVEVSPDAVLVENTFYAVGKDSGMPVTLRSAIVFVFGGEKIIRCLAHPTRDEALRAAGLGSQG